MSLVTTKTDARGRTWITITAGAGKRRHLASPSLHGQRVRFNWGYHDGAREQRDGRELRDMSTHYDLAYADGYTRGVADQAAGTYAETSTAAWQASGRPENFEGWR